MGDQIVASDSLAISLFDFDEFGSRRQLLDRLVRLPHAEAYAMMRRLREVEIESFETAELAALVFAMTPALENLPLQSRTGYTPAELARRFAFARAMRIAEDCYLAIFALAGHAAEFVDYGNIEMLEALESQGTPVVLAPLHIGAYQSSILLLASRGFSISVLAVPDLMPSVSEEEAAVRLKFGETGPDLQLIAQGRGAALNCRRALRAGRMVSIFADVWDVERMDESRSAVVPFMGVHVRVPAGIATIAQRAGAVVVPFVSRLNASGDQQYRFFRPIETQPRDDPAVVASVLLECVEHELMREAPWDWEGWRMMHDMLVVDHEGQDGI